MIPNIVNSIALSNLDRRESDISRRFIKVVEEIGEVSEAYLSCTSSNNYKQKTWSDFREECVDVLIVLVDIYLTNKDQTSLERIISDIEYYNQVEINCFADVENNIFGLLSDVISAKNLIINSLNFKAFMSKALIKVSALCFTDFADNQSSIEIVTNLVNKKLDKWNQIRDSVIAIGGYE